MIQEDGRCEDIGQSTALTCNLIKRTPVKEILTLGPFSRLVMTLSRLD